MGLSQIANWDAKGNEPALIAAIEAAGIYLVYQGGAWCSDNPTAAQAIITAFDPLPWLKAQKQAALDAVFDANFDLAKFIRGGSSTSVTATNVGTFLATITNNYRSKRAAIAAAASQAALAAIDINAGWPANP